MLLQFIQCAGSEFQLLITLLLNTNFLTSSLNLHLNNFLSYPVRPSSTDSKINLCYYRYLAFIILYVSIKSLLTPLFCNRVKPKYFSRSSYFKIFITLHQLCSSPLNIFNQLNVFNQIWTPYLYTIFQMWSNETFV